MAISLLLKIFSIIGLFISFYFLSAKKGWFPNFVKNVPLCESNMCIRVSDSRYGSIFGIPNYIFGGIYYIIIFAVSFFELDNIVLYSLLIVSWGTVAFAVYLTYALLVKLKTICIPCFISHGINLGIAVLVTLLV